MSDQHLVITKYTIHNNTAVGPAGDYIGTTNIILEGLTSPPYTIVSAQLLFVPDTQILNPPSWNDPHLVCEKHQSEYYAVMDMVNKGIENKKPTTSFTIDYRTASNDVVMILSY